MEDWDQYIRRYQDGEWRSPIFRDMVLDDAQKAGTRLTFLDIGCGNGFDGCWKLQESLSDIAGNYIGIEPDKGVSTGPYLSEIHRCQFEQATLEPQSVDIAFAVMVLEHIREPKAFWNKLHEVLCDGGIFWGFTVDARHWFRKASVLAELLRIKKLYLRAVARHDDRNR